MLKQAWEIAKKISAKPRAYAGSVSNVLTGIPGMGMAARHPFIATPALYYGGKHLGYEGIAKPLWSGAMGPDPSRMNPYTQMVADSKQRREQQSKALRTRVEYEDIQRRMAKAAMRLAALDPHLYNEVMAGRSLPKDAVVFGGQPRTDLMEELAMGMTQGQFKEQPTAHDELMQELGV